MLKTQHHNTMPLTRVDEVTCETVSSSCDDGSLGGTLRAVGSCSSRRDRKKKVLKIKASDLQNNTAQVDPKHVEKVMKRLQSDKPVTIIEKSSDSTVETKRQLLCRTSSRLRTMIRTVSWVGSRGRSSSNSDGKGSNKEKTLRSCLKNKREYSSTGMCSNVERPTLSQQRSSWKALSFRYPSKNSHSSSSSQVPTNDIAKNDNERPTLPSRGFSWQSLSFRKNFCRRPTNLNRWDSDEELPVYPKVGNVGLKQPMKLTDSQNNNSSCHSCHKEFTVVSPYAVIPMTSHSQPQRKPRRFSMDNVPIAPRRILSNEQPRRCSMDNVPVLPRRILSNEDLSQRL